MLFARKIFHKKGMWFPPILVLIGLTMLIVAAVIISVKKSPFESELGTSQLELQQIIRGQQKMQMYLQSAATTSSEVAYSTTALHYSSSCGTYYGYSLWNKEDDNSCAPTPEKVEQQFVTSFNELLDKHIVSYNSVVDPDIPLHNFAAYLANKQLQLYSYDNLQFKSDHVEYSVPFSLQMFTSVDFAVFTTIKTEVDKIISIAKQDTKDISMKEKILHALKQYSGNAYTWKTEDQCISKEQQVILELIEELHRCGSDEQTKVCILSLPDESVDTSFSILSFEDHSLITIEEDIELPYTIQLVGNSALDPRYTTASLLQFKFSLFDGKPALLLHINDRDLIYDEHIFVYRDEKGISFIDPTVADSFVDIVQTKKLLTQQDQYILFCVEDKSQALLTQTDYKLKIASPRFTFAWQIRPDVKVPSIVGVTSQDKQFSEGTILLHVPWPKIEDGTYFQDLKSLVIYCNDQKILESDSQVSDLELTATLDTSLFIPDEKGLTIEITQCGRKKLLDLNSEGKEMHYTYAVTGKNSYGTENTELKQLLEINLANGPLDDLPPGFGTVADSSNSDVPFPTFDASVVLLSDEQGELSFISKSPLVNLDDSPLLDLESLNIYYHLQGDSGTQSLLPLEDQDYYQSKPGEIMLSGLYPGAPYLLTIAGVDEVGNVAHFGQNTPSQALYPVYVNP